MTYTINKKEKIPIITDSQEEAFKALEVGVTVNHYNEDGDLMACCGVVDYDEIKKQEAKKAELDAEKDNIIEYNMTTTGSLDLFAYAQTRAHLYHLELTIQNREQYTRKFLFMSKTEEVVLFTVKGPREDVLKYVELAKEFGKSLEEE